MGHAVVRASREADLPVVRRLYALARHAFVNFGDEDFPAYVASAGPLYGWLAEEEGRVRAFAAWAARRAEWPELRGLFLSDAWPNDSLLAALFQRVEEDLRRLGAEGLMCLVADDWLAALLARVGFRLEERVISLYRPRAPLPEELPAEPSLCLRPARGEDVSALVALDDAAFDPMWRLGRHGVSLYLVTTAHFVVAEEDGALIGYVVADARGDEAQVIRLAVHPAKQRQGIGRRLLLDALAYARDAGAGTVVLNTQAGNEASLRLYHGLGFRDFGRAVSVWVRRLR